MKLFFATMLIFSSMIASAKTVEKRKPNQADETVLIQNGVRQKASYEDIVRAMNAAGKCGDELSGGARAEIYCFSSRADGQVCSIFKIKECEQ